MDQLALNTVEIDKLKEFRDNHGDGIYTVTRTPTSIGSVYKAIFRYGENPPIECDITDYLSW